MDASDVSIGGFLGQIEDNKVRIIAYFNKSLNKTEQKWSAVEREMYAIITAMEMYRPIIADTKVSIYTDHKPLLFLNKLKQTSNMRLNRWAIILSGYDFKVMYVEGPRNQLADSLSRF